MLGTTTSSWRIAMIVETSYLTPTELRPIVLAFVVQVATWDDIEETWEIHVPCPLCIHTKVDLSNGYDYFEDLTQWHEWACQNDVEYSYAVPDYGKNVLSVAGLVV
jgi:hypothetical protein